MMRGGSSRILTVKIDVCRGIIQLQLAAGLVLNL
jgi:hypothetical protein